MIARALAVAVLFFAAGAAGHELRARSDEQARAADRVARAEQKRAERAGKPRRIRQIKDGVVISVTYVADPETTNTEN